MKAAMSPDREPGSRSGKANTGLPGRVPAALGDAGHEAQNRSPWRVAAAAGIVAVGFLAVAVVIALGMRSANPGARDFIEYWAAEQQLVHHGNPYDPVALLSVERGGGFNKSQAEFWYGPPASLVLALPLGFASARIGLILWTLLQFSCLAASLWLFWQIDGRPNTLLYLCGFLFAPAVLCLQAGQISLLLLFGVTLFLRFHDSRPLIAGAALLPCALKPHLFLPMAVVLLLWEATRRCWRIIAGFATALTAGHLTALSFDPLAWQQYTQLMKSDSRVLHEFVPTLSECFRYAIDQNAVWLRFVPVALGCTWAAWYFWTRRNRWSWMDQGMVVLLVSALCRPYGWVFDESVLLPAVMSGAVRARYSARALLPLAIVAAAALVEAGRGAGVMSNAYLWTTPAWFACTLLARMTAKAQGQPTDGIEEGVTEPDA
jgi:hypothetical protein